MSVITRFAPSPTGYLHIGGARTALFNYVFAKSQGGQYLLRIEDTDKARSTTEAIDAIHDGLSWLGLEGDGEAVMQSQRADRHAEIAHQLIELGHAYRCYLTDEELTNLRDAARDKGIAVRSPWRDGGDAPQNASFVVRLKMPDEGVLIINDLVQGQVEVKASQLDDMVILRSDGSPTYMLAVVVDDHDMGITHIIRGDDHLNNAFRQQMVYQAMGWDVPLFAHIPLIHGADGAKLSKRHGALGVDAYRDEGYLPEAMVNYLMRLGWSHGDEELFTISQAIDWFDIAKVGKSPSRFDTDKLRSVNQHHMRNASAQSLANHIIKANEHLDISVHANDRLLSLMPLLTDRATTLNELASGQAYILQDGAPMMNEEAAALLDDEAKTLLADFAEALGNDFANLDEFKSFLNAFLAERSLKMKHIGLPLRAVLTGTKSSPSITDIAVALGTKEMKSRIDAICKS